MWWTATVALAQSTTTPPTEEVIVAADPWPVRVTGYLLPRQDPAWITDEAPVRSCTVRVRFAPGAELEVTPGTCPEPMPEAMVAATRRWTFEPAEGAPEGSTTFAIHYVVRYEAVIQAMLMHAEVDPGPERALAGARGSVGLQLVHPASPVKQTAARAKGAPPAPCRLRLTIDGNGRVAASEPLACPDALREPAAKAVRRWRYTPRIVDGMTMPEAVEVEVPFR